MVFLLLIPPFGLSTKTYNTALSGDIQQSVLLRCDMLLLVLSAGFAGC
jgi:hypothetical protein